MIAKHRPPLRVNRIIDPARLEEMVLDGLKQREIARIFGVSQPSVSAAIRIMNRRKCTHKLSAKQVSEMRRMYREGRRVVDLAEWYHVAEATVRYHLRDMPKTTPRGPRRKEERAAA